jgi:cysteinyl-tRNA synthetase
VVALLNETATAVNSLCDGFSGKEREQTKTLADYYAALREIGGLLGIFQRKPSDYMEQTKEKRTAQKGITVAEIEQAIRDREQARAEKDYAKADAIRQKLAEKGVELKDSAAGTGWSVKAG